MVETSDGFLSLDNYFISFDNQMLDNLHNGFDTKIGSKYFPDHSKEGHVKVLFQRNYPIFGIK